MKPISSDLSYDPANTMQYQPSTPVSSIEGLKGIYKNAFEEQLKYERERIIDQATEEFREKVRRAVMSVVFDLNSVFSVERVGPELMIRVRMEEGRERGEEK